MPALTVFTTPRTIRHGPYTFVAGGHIVNPTTATPPPLACVGTVDIRFIYQRRTIASAVAGVLPDCTYGGTISLRRLPGKRKGKGHGPRVVKVDVVSKFLGNNYLAPACSKTLKITLG